jgi:hypothetical protein
MEYDLASVGTWVAFALTLMVYCYLGRDIPFLNAIYRLAVYLLVGVALGYGAVMAWHGVLVPRLFQQLERGQWFYLVPLVLCVFLLLRFRRSWRGMGNLTMAFLFGVGAALAVGGALVGTLLPQVQATFVSLNPIHYENIASTAGSLPAIYALDALLIVIATVSTLFYFYFSAKPGAGTARSRLVHSVAAFGKVCIMFTFGALFAMAAITRIASLVDRLRFLVETVWPYIPAL